MEQVDFPIPEGQPDSLPDEGEKPPSHPDIPNFAGNKETVDHARNVLKSKLDIYKSDREDNEEAVWKKADFMYTVALNDSTRGTEQTDDTRADTGSTLFYRQVITLISQGLTVQLSRPMPGKFNPIFNKNVFLSAEEGEYMANQHNALAEWNMKRDDFNLKSYDVWLNGVKYGNVPIEVFWKQSKQERDVRVPIRDEEGNVTGYNFVRQEFQIDDQFSFRVLLNDNFYADRNVGDIQKQVCMLYESLETLGYFYDNQRAGNFENVENIGKEHLFSGYLDNDTRTEKDLNRQGDGDDDMNTGLFLTTKGFLYLGLDEKGNLDEDAEPKKYIAVFAGNGMEECVSLIRNDDPDDEWPIRMLHLLPDDTEKLYHLSPSQIVSSNFNEQTTLKNQSIDWTNLQIDKPLKVIKGETYNTSFEFGPDVVYFVDRPESVTEFQMQNILPDLLGMLNFLEEDSKSALFTNKPIIGEALGGRTSATEAQNVFEQSSKPHFVMIHYFLSQFIGFYLRKFARYWQKYGDPELVREVLGEDLVLDLKPGYLYGTFDVVVDVVDEFETNTVIQQALDGAIQTLSASPVFQPHLNVPSILEDYFSVRLKRSNPAKYVKYDQAKDAQRLAHKDAMNMLFSAQWIDPDPEGDLETRKRIFDWVILEAQATKDQYPGYDLVVRHRDMVSVLNNQKKAQLQAPMPGQPQNSTPGQVTGNAIAAQLGAQNAQ